MCLDQSRLVVLGHLAIKHEEDQPERIIWQNTGDDLSQMPYCGLHPVLASGPGRYFQGKLMSMFESLNPVGQRIFVWTTVSLTTLLLATNVATVLA